MMNLKVILFALFFCSFASAQVVYHPIESDVYRFLERQSLKNIIEYHDEVLPLSRKKIGDYLLSIKNEWLKLNKIEKDELNWWLMEFEVETGRNGMMDGWSCGAGDLDLTGWSEVMEGSEVMEDWNNGGMGDWRDKSRLLEIKNKKFYLYQYTDSLFNLRVSPIAGYEISKTGDAAGHKRWWGAYFYGTVSDWFGASLNLRDIGEFGDNVDRRKIFSRETGHTLHTFTGGVEHSDVRGALNFSWDWGSVSLRKDYLILGHGKFGQLIHSTKAPSYPHILLQLKPVNWFRFHYMFGSLTSNVFDSSRFYYTNVGTLFPHQREIFINKYIALNLLSITPWDWLDFSVGNATVYAGEIRMENFIPFMFFKYLDRDTGHGSVEDGNGVLFFDAVIRAPETFKFYTTFFLDVTELRNVFKKDFSNTWYGITLGGKKIDLIIPNLDFTVEYTRITPWVYEHKDEATTYKHIDYTLGHWIGQNADQFRLQLDYQFIRGLRSSIYFENIRKGGLKDIYFAYKDREQEPFLYAPVRKDKTFGLDLSYEYLHDLFAKFTYQYSNIEDEDPVRTPEWQLRKNHSFSIALYYGL